jgi:hypothetical protein
VSTVGDEHVAAWDRFAVWGEARRRAPAAGAEFRLGASGPVRKVVVLAGLDDLLLPTEG